MLTASTRLTHACNNNSKLLLLVGERALIAWTGLWKGIDSLSHLGAAAGKAQDMLLFWKFGCPLVRIVKYLLTTVLCMMWLSLLFTRSGPTAILQLGLRCLRPTVRWSVVLRYDNSHHQIFFREIFLWSESKVDTCVDVKIKCFHVFKFYQVGAKQTNHHFAKQIFCWTNFLCQPNDAFQLMPRMW